MAYYTGTAASFALLKTAIEDACVAQGWTLSSGILSLEGCYVQLTADTTNTLDLLVGNGQSGSSLTTAAPRSTRVRSFTAFAIDWPLDYEIHIFNDPELEVYCVINHNTDYYSCISFGQSRIAGIGGSGNWQSAPRKYNTPAELSGGGMTSVNITFNEIVPIANSVDRIGFFFELNPGSDDSTSRIHVGLDSSGWCASSGNSSSLTDVKSSLSPLAGLLSSIPNVTNQGTILFPAKALKVRNSNGRTLVWSPPHFRWTRNDYLSAGELLTYGSDQWKVYPAFRKNASARNGSSSSSGANHSGTLAYAIQYTGP